MKLSIKHYLLSPLICVLVIQFFGCISQDTETRSERESEEKIDLAVLLDRHQKIRHDGEWDLVQNNYVAL